jgi:hypothetical protein
MISHETKVKECLTIFHAIREAGKTPNLVRNQEHGAKSFLRSY